ncbi:putative ArsR family transcriptional regulator [Rhizobium aquaticum]|uniref:ArsR family transcriptional regulator n=1 Tax=Rhizobium aquaticum TaxID=1549636 RepID=A0ABV2IW55_9HYPH
MKMPRFIRKELIVPNMEELKRYGDLRAVPSNPGKPGRPSLRYYLNREQANLVSIFSRTEKARCPQGTRALREFGCD